MGILQGQVHDLHHFLSIRMGIFPAGLRAIGVNHTIIIRTQKRTGRALQHKVLVFIDAQVFLHKVSGLHLERPGNTLDIRLIKYGTGGLTTIGAGETVCFFEYFLVGLVESIINQPRVLFLQPQKEFLVLRGLAFGQIMVMRDIHEAAYSSSSFFDQLVMTR